MLAAQEVLTMMQGISTTQTASIKPASTAAMITPSCHPGRPPPLPACCGCAVARSGKAGVPAMAKAGLGADAPRASVPADGAGAGPLSNPIMPVIAPEHFSAGCLCTDCQLGHCGSCKHASLCLQLSVRLSVSVCPNTHQVQEQAPHLAWLQAPRQVPGLELGRAPE